MSSSQDSDIDLECKRIIRPKKFNAKLMASLDTDGNSTQSQNHFEIIKGNSFKNKKYQKVQEKNCENATNKYIRRLPIAFSILHQGMAQITSNFKATNENYSSQTQNTTSISPSSQKNLSKLLKFKRFQQDGCNLQEKAQDSKQTIQKNRRKQLTQTYHHPHGINFLNQQTLINEVRLQQKTMPIFTQSNRHRTQIIKQIIVGGNKIRTNWHKGLINGYTQIDYKDKGKFRGIFQQGEMASGQMTFSNGFIYTGEFSVYKFHGVGKLKFPSGQIFEGNWFFGSLHGKAKIFYPQGQFYYGQVKNFKRDGQGYLYFQNGDKYVGQFLQGEITGFGQLHKNGICSQKGYWVDGKFVGNQQSVYLKKKGVNKNQKYEKNKKNQKMPFDFFDQFNEFRQMNQMLKKNQSSQAYSLKTKLCVSFNESLNQQFQTKSKDSQQQLGWPKLNKQTSLGLLAT